MQMISEHLQEWIQTGRATLTSSDIAARFAAYLSALPWRESGSGLDWDRIGGNSSNLAVLTERELLDWLSLTSLGRDPYLVFWFGPNDPCIACEFQFAVANIDQAFWKAPGTRYIFGAAFKGQNMHPFFDHFAEYDGADRLTAKR